MEEWEAVDSNLKKLLSQTSLDEATSRRKIHEAFKDVQLSIDHCLFKQKYTGLKIEESYETNSSGLEIFTKSWLPEKVPIKSLVCFCQGYGGCCTFFVEGIAKKIASCGHGVFTMDYPGFGLSEGLHGYIPSFDSLVDYVIEHFSKIKEKPEYNGLPRFLFGESMGGAVALKIHFKQPNAWDGAILLSPMCKIADDVVPPWLVQQMLIGIANFFPKSKLVPEKDLTSMAFRDKKKREQTIFNVTRYRGRPRLGTAVEMLRATQEIGQRLKEVSLPLLILHGEADTVTDPSVSKDLYEQANSSDKKLILYKDAYHCLIEGEPDEVIFQVLDDIISWLDQHQTKISSDEEWKGSGCTRTAILQDKPSTQKFTSAFVFIFIVILSLLPYIIKQFKMN